MTELAELPSQRDDRRCGCGGPEDRATQFQLWTNRMTSSIQGKWVVIAIWQASGLRPLVPSDSWPGGRAPTKSGRKPFEHVVNSSPCLCAYYYSPCLSPATITRTFRAWPQGRHPMLGTDC